MTGSREFAEKVSHRVESRLADLPTRAIAAQALERNGLIILVEHLQRAVKIANRKAPEHLEIQVLDPGRLVSELMN